MTQYPKLKNWRIKYDVSIVLVHHNRKASDSSDFINNASGSTGLTGAADSLLVLQRTRMGNVAKLQVTGHDIEERELALSRNGMGWKLEGNAYEFTMSQDKLAIIDFLRENGDSTSKQIAEGVGDNPSTVKTRIRSMAKAGDICHNRENHTYGLPPVARLHIGRAME